MWGGTRGLRTSAGCRLFPRQNTSWPTASSRMGRRRRRTIPRAFLGPPTRCCVAAKRAQIVKSDFAFNESIQFIPTPGHTIDHYSVLVGRPGRDALITGDMIHSPIQGKYPELGMRAD